LFQGHHWRCLRHLVLASDKIDCPILDPILVVQFSVKIVSDMVPKHQNLVQNGTIHFSSGGPKFGHLHQTSWPQTPKIQCSQYETSVPISWVLHWPLSHSFAPDLANYHLVDHSLEHGSIHRHSSSPSWLIVLDLVSIQLIDSAFVILCRQGIEACRDNIHIRFWWIEQLWWVDNSLHFVLLVIGVCYFDGIQ